MDRCMYHPFFAWQSGGLGNKSYRPTTIQLLKLCESAISQLKLIYVGVALRARMYDLDHEANRSPGDCKDFTLPALQRNPVTAETR